MTITTVTSLVNGHEVTGRYACSEGGPGATGGFALWDWTLDGEERDSYGEARAEALGVELNEEGGE